MIRFILLRLLLSLPFAASLQAGDSANEPPGGDQSLSALQKRVAENPDNLEYRYDLGIAYNELAMDGDEDALERAMAIMEGILRDEPATRKARAMLGSMTVMKAQHAPLFSKLDYVKEGYGILDEIVEEHPDDPDLRLIRGANAARSPGFLGRGDVADEDFNWLVADIKRNPRAYNDNYTRTIFYYAGDWFLERREKRSVELLFRAKALPGAPRLAEPIKESLKKAKKMFPATYRSFQSQ